MLAILLSSLQCACDMTHLNEAFLVPSLVGSLGCISYALVVSFLYDMGTTKSEDILGEKWDRCVSDTVIKMGMLISRCFDYSIL